MKDMILATITVILFCLFGGIYNILEKRTKNKWVLRTPVIIFIILTFTMYIGCIAINIDCSRNTVVSDVTGELVSVSGGHRGAMNAEFNVDGDIFKVRVVSANNLNVENDVSFKKITYRNKYYWYVLSSDYYEGEDYDIVTAKCKSYKIFKFDSNTNYNKAVNLEDKYKVEYLKQNLVGYYLD